MDVDLRKALEGAEGLHEYIFAVVADIRDFSAFSERHDSSDVGNYIKRVYAQLIDNYFPFAKFYKATGDGLLMTAPYHEDNLAETAKKTVDGCLRCIGEFADICGGDPMINFSTPNRIGFGIARGAACRLVSADTVLDYSGQLLNLASRLMGLARPSGIVLDGAFGIELLDKDIRDLFVAQDVHVRGVAEDEPRRVYVLKDVVEIPKRAKRPAPLENWEVESTSFKVREWREHLPRFKMTLAKRLKRRDGIIVHLIHEKKGDGRPTRVSLRQKELDADGYSYGIEANKPSVVLHVDKMMKYSKRSGLTLDQELAVRITYVPE